MNGIKFNLNFYINETVVCASCFKCRVSKIPQIKVAFTLNDTPFNLAFYELNHEGAPYTWFRLSPEEEPIAQAIARALAEKKTDLPS